MPNSVDTSPLHRRVESLLALPRHAKKTLAIMADTSLCVLTVWLAVCLRFESWVSLSGYQWLAVALSVFLAIPLLTAFGFYHTVIRYAGRQTITAALRAMSIYAIIYSAVFTAYGFPLVPRTIGILQPFLLLISLALIRLLASQLLGEQIHTTATQANLPIVLIYGAGNSGQQLASSLKAKGESRVLGFLDDNTSLHKARIAGIPVYSPHELQTLSQQHQVRDVLLAMPSLSRSRRTDIIKGLSQSRIAVRTLPSLTDLASGKVSEDDLRELDIEDLLGREPVAPIQELLRANIAGKNVLVTGAGGSIGSELVRQIWRLEPEHLILVELNELALYSIHEELMSRAGVDSPRLTFVLANVLDKAIMLRLACTHLPHTIFHAAAYKHVPLVEANAMTGLRNNILGTLNMIEAAHRSQCNNFVLISTDKAVRPTNIMGVSKRLAEIAVQSFANHLGNECLTHFTIVRFGNVLASSGSVVPKFRDQIRTGGPVTVTHPDITRYFMTIPEAAQLVMQAAAMTTPHPQEAALYVLDMGAPVKIFDLAENMIRLSGFKPVRLKEAENDIAIEFTGLRPGEKLFEELLIGSQCEHTEHPKIKRAYEQFVSWDVYEDKLHKLFNENSDASFTELQSAIRILVSEYQPQMGTP